MNSFFLKDLGLLNGKMGIVLSLFEYARKTHNDVVYDYADTLFSSILDEIHQEMCFSFCDGLSGIGWGIEYLLQNNFMNGDSVEICEEIDRLIMEIDTSRIMDMSLDKGFEGLMHYVLYHIQGASRKNKIPFDSKYLTDIYNTCKKAESIDKESLNSIIYLYKLFFEKRFCNNYNYKIENLMSCLTKYTDIVDLTNYPLCLNNGLAGLLLKLTK